MPFKDLDLGWNIAILIILGLLVLYILTVFVALTFVVSFKSMMKRDNRGLRVAMSAKLDILKKFEEIIENKKIKLSEECLHSLKYLDTEDFLEAQKEEFEVSRNELNEVENEIKRVIADNQKKLSKDDEVQVLMSLLHDVNDSLKNSTTMYNADILGYNYWIRFPPCKFIFILFGTKIKKTI